MAATAFWYGQTIANAFGSTGAGGAPNIDFLSDTIKCMLCTNAYTPNQDTHQFKSDVTNEISGTGYTATGATLATKALTYTGGTNTIMFDADDAAWSGASFTARYAVVYDATPGTDATRPLMFYIDFGADVTVSAGTLTIQFNAAGIGTVVVS